MIHILIIDHRHGRDVFAGQTREAARSRLASWARDNWVIEQIPGDIPEDDDQAIELYFEVMTHNVGEEFWEILELELS